MKRVACALGPLAVLMVSCGDPEGSVAEATRRTRHEQSLPICPSGVLRVLDGYDAEVDEFHPTEPFLLRDNGLAITTALKGPQPEGAPNYYRRAWLSPNSYGYGPSLAYEVRACSDDCDSCDSGIRKQKINHHVLQSAPEVQLEFDQRRHIGFAFRVSGEQPLHDTILFQLWQGSPHGPPLSASLRTEEDGSMSLVFKVLNNETGSSPSAPRLEIGKIENINMTEWYGVSLSLYPEHVGIEHREGNATVGVRYKREGESEYQTALRYFGKWGYDPATNCQYANKCEESREYWCEKHCDTQVENCIAGTTTEADNVKGDGECSRGGESCFLEPASFPKDKIDFKIGIYRTGEDTALQVRFDNVKLTKSHWQSLPEYWCDWQL